jgi:hypothetical protein
MSSLYFGLAVFCPLEATVLEFDTVHLTLDKLWDQRVLALSAFWYFVQWVLSFWPAQWQVGNPSGLLVQISRECTPPYRLTGISNLLKPAQAEVVLGQRSTYLASWSGTIASYWQSTSSPKYNDDISLLISQYIISGWTHSSLSPLQCPSSSRMYYSSWTYTDLSNHTTVYYVSLFNKTQLLKNNELFTNLNKLLVSNYQQLSPTSFTLTSFVSWNYRSDRYMAFNKTFTVVYLLTVFFSHLICKIFVPLYYIYLCPMKCVCVCVLK